MTDASVVVTEGDVTVTGVDARKESDEPPDLDLHWLCQLAAGVLTVEGVAAGQLDLHLLDSADMETLNVEQMGHTGPTDVLSFPLDAGDEPDPTASAAEMILLGDVVLCPTVATAQAPEHVGDVRGELALLTIHGVLHVLGHDHVEIDETLQMQDRERVHLAKLGVDHPVAA